MKVALICAAAAIVFALFFAWCMTQIHFRIGSRHLKVLLFGLTIRRIALANIAYASKRESKGLAERWYSTFKTSHRLLTIERKRGLVRRVCITPQNRYVFLADLKAAVRRVDPEADWAALGTLDETSHGKRRRQEESESPHSPKDSAATAPATDPG